MKKNMLIVGILVAIMLVTISFTTVIGSNNNVENKKISSPLFKIRMKKAVGTFFEKIKEIKTNFLKNRFIFIPFSLKYFAQNDFLLSVGNPRCYSMDCTFSGPCTIIGDPCFYTLFCKGP